MSVELLSPAGSYESISAAVYGGADAVYFGGNLLNARMRSKNFDNESIDKAVNFCHSKGVRTYVTVNTLVLDRECDSAIRFVDFLYRAGVDALIVADIGLSRKIHNLYPDLPLHASTQMSGHNSAGANFLKEIGFQRMVFARELSKENIILMKGKTDIELEMFIHGAYCASHSGQCLCSWAMGGRSGNRGECAQPCRKMYNGEYPLSLKDNCLAGHITEILKLGIASLKIEGRLKSPDYVYAVTSQYRKLLDEERNATPEEIQYLEKVFSRNGFTDGYYTDKIGKFMLGTRREDNKFSASVVKKDFNREKIDVVRHSVALPQEKISFNTAKSERDRKSTARFFRADQITKSSSDYFDTIYLPLNSYSKVYDNVIGVVLPEVITDKEYETVKMQLEKAYSLGARHALVGNIGHINLAKECGYILHGDFRLNISNNGSAEFYSGIMDDFILSPELSLPQIKGIIGKKSLITYGRIPLMVLEKKVEEKFLLDDKKIKFPVISSGSRDLLINSAPVWMADKEKELKEAFAYNRHFIFSVERKQDVDSVIECYKSCRKPDGMYKRIKM